MQRYIQMEGARGKLLKIIFLDASLEEIYLNKKTKDKKYKKLCRNKTLVDGYITAIDTMKGVANTEQLKLFSYLHYEKLKYQGRDMSSVRLSNSYVERLLFEETADGIEIKLIEIDSTHYGNKK